LTSGWIRYPVGVETLSRLKESRASLGGPATDARLAIFARAGFTDGLLRRAAEERVLLVTAEDLFAEATPGPGDDAA